MRKLSSILLIALLAVVGVGCDSNDDESDSDKFVGTWVLTDVADNDGSALEAFGQLFQSVTLTNKADETFTLTVVPTAGAQMSIPGTYSVSESNKKFVLTASTQGTTANLNFTYDFLSSDQVKLTSDVTTVILLNQLFGSDLNGTAVITITKQ